MLKTNTYFCFQKICMKFKNVKSSQSIKNRIVKGYKGIADVLKAIKKILI